jgi:hypothetical protein
VRVGNVCRIDDHKVPIPVGSKLAGGTERRMVPAKKLHPRSWAEYGYDTAWVPENCPDHVFKGGRGWNEGIKEEACVFDPKRVTPQRRVVWDTDRAEVKTVKWLFKEDRNRLGAHDVVYLNEWVPFSSRNSIMLESHFRVFEDKTKGGRSQVMVNIECDRKKFNKHTGLRYEVDLVRMKERNVMTGFERPLRRMPHAAMETTTISERY